MPRHTASKPPVPRLSRGPSLTYTPVRGPLVKTARQPQSYLAEAAEKLAGIATDVYKIRQEKNKELALRAGRLAFAQRKAIENLPERSGKHGATWAKLGWLSEAMKEKGAAYQTEISREAVRFGSNPENNDEDWEENRKQFETEFMAKHGINTEFKVDAFQAYLDPRRGAPGNIFRQANISAVSQYTINATTERLRPDILGVLYQSADVPENPIVEHPDGTPGLDGGKGIPSTSLLASYKGIGLRKEKAELNPDKSLEDIKNNISRLVEDAIADKIPVEKVAIWNNVKEMMLQHGMTLYVNAVHDHQFEKAQEYYEDLDDMYHILLEMKKTPGGKTGVFNAKTILDLTARKTKLRIEHEANLTTIADREPATVRLAFRKVFQKRILKKDFAGMSWDDIRAALPGMIEESNAIPEGIRNSPHILDSLTNRIFLDQRTEITNAVIAETTEARHGLEQLALRSTETFKIISRNLNKILSQAPDDYKAFETIFDQIDEAYYAKNLTKEHRDKLRQDVNLRMDDKSFIGEIPDVPAIIDSINTVISNHPEAIEYYVSVLRDRHYKSFQNDPHYAKKWEEFYKRHGWSSARKRGRITKWDVHDALGGVLKYGEKEIDFVEPVSINSDMKAKAAELYTNKKALTRAVEDSITKIILDNVKKLEEGNGFGLAPNLLSIDLQAEDQVHMARFIKKLVDDEILSKYTIIRGLKGNKDWDPSNPETREVNLEFFKNQAPPVSRDFPSEDLPSESPVKKPTSLQQGFQATYGKLSTEERLAANNRTKPSEVAETTAKNAFKNFTETELRPLLKEWENRIKHLTDRLNDPTLDPFNRATLSDEWAKLVDNYRAMSGLLAPSTGIIATSRGSYNALDRLILMLNESGVYDSMGNLRPTEGGEGHWFAPTMKAIRDWIEVSAGSTVWEVNDVPNHWSMLRVALFGDESNMERLTSVEVMGKVDEAWGAMFIENRDTGRFELREDDDPDDDNVFAQLWNWSGWSLNLSDQEKINYMVEIRDTQRMFANQEKHIETPLEGLDTTRFDPTYFPLKPLDRPLQRGRFGKTNILSWHHWNTVPWGPREGGMTPGKVQGARRARETKDIHQAAAEADKAILEQLGIRISAVEHPKGFNDPRNTGFLQALTTLEVLGTGGFTLTGPGPDDYRYRYLSLTPPNLSFYFDDSSKSTSRIGEFTAIKTGTKKTLRTMHAANGENIPPYFIPFAVLNQHKTMGVGTQQEILSSIPLSMRPLTYKNWDPTLPDDKQGRLYFHTKDTLLANHAKRLELYKAYLEEHGELYPDPGRPKKRPTISGEAPVVERIR